MRVLLDNCVDVRFARLIPGHEVVHARDLGWQELENGQLLAAADEERFQVVVTIDKNMRFQQNIAARRLSLVTLSPKLTELDFLAPLAAKLAAVLGGEIAPGSVIVLEPDR